MSEGTEQASSHFPQSSVGNWLRKTAGLPLEHFSSRLRFCVPVQRKPVCVCKSYCSGSQAVPVSLWTKHRYWTYDINLWITVRGLLFVSLIALEVNHVCPALA